MMGLKYARVAKININNYSITNHSYKKHEYSQSPTPTKSTTTYATMNAMYSTPWLNNARGTIMDSTSPSHS